MVRPAGRRSVPGDGQKGWRRKHSMAAAPPGRIERHSATGENRLEAGFGEDALHLVAFVALDFDAAIFDRAAAAAGFLHFFREDLFLSEPDAGEIFGHGDDLAAAMGGLPDDIHAAPVGIFLTPLRGLDWNDAVGIGGIGRPRRQIAERGQRAEWIRRQAWGLAVGLVSLVTTHPGQSTTDGEDFTLYSAVHGRDGHTSLAATAPLRL